MSLTAVLADDRKDYRDIAHVALRKHGFKIVAECSNGTEALDAVRKHDPDLVVLDYIMPNGTGGEAAVKIRAEGWRAKIILATSMGQKGAAFSDNVPKDAVLIKPYNDPLVLLALMQTGLIADG